MDTQVVELLGRNWLISQLLKGGLEVSLPLRDKGIDLIVYLDKNKFVSCPVQMKASTKASFSLDKKYEKFPNMILAYVWYLEDANKTVSYALTYSEALQVCEKMGWTKTESWKKGFYSTTKPSDKLLKLLELYKMTTKRWQEKVLQLVG